jgi:hypothetical protein
MCVDKLECLIFANSLHTLNQRRKLTKEIINKSNMLTCKHAIKDVHLITLIPANYALRYLHIQLRRVTF